MATTKAPRLADWQVHELAAHARGEYAQLLALDLLDARAALAEARKALAAAEAETEQVRTEALASLKRERETRAALAALVEECDRIRRARWIISEDNSEVAAAREVLK